MIVALALLALLQLYARGYLLPSVALAPVLGWLVWGLRRMPWEGAQLSWSEGIWSLRVDQESHTLLPEPESVAIPWLVLCTFRFAANGQRQHFWVFADAAAASELRKLRVRLTLPDPRGEVQ